MLKFGHFWNLSPFFYMILREKWPSRYRPLNKNRLELKASEPILESRNIGLQHYVKTNTQLYTLNT